MSHTPTPWIIGHPEDHSGQILIATQSGRILIATCDMPGEVDLAEREANAAFILRACNAHDELLAALKAQDIASRFAAEVSAATPDGQPPKKHLMDTADKLFARAEQLRLAAIAKAEGK